MTGAVIDHNPEGQGRTRASRATDELGIAEGLPAYCTTLWEPQEFQAKVLASMRGITFAIGGIGSGKSEAVHLLLLKWALKYPRRADGRPTKWFVVGPEFALIREEQFAKILAHCRRLKELGYGTLVRRVVYGQDPKIVLRDGQVILGRSGDQYKRMEGVEVDGALLDEAQRQPEKAFQTAVSRVRSTDDIRIAVAANPEDVPGWLWRIVNGQSPKYNKIRARLLSIGSGMRVFRWASASNKANNPGVLGVIQSVMDATSETFSAKQLLGRFPGTPEAPSMGVNDYARAFVGRINLLRERAIPFSLGVDVGETEDFSVLTILSQRGVVLATKRFNAGTPGVPRATFYQYLEDVVAEVATRSRIKKVIFDIAKAGKPVCQKLEVRLRDICRVEGFGTDAARKKAEAIEVFLLACSNGDFVMPSEWVCDGEINAVTDEAQLRKELDEMVIIDHGNGKRSFTHPPGGHDDCIVSAALAYHGFQGTKPQRTDYGGWNPRREGSGPRFGGGLGGRFSGGGGRFTGR